MPHLPDNPILNSPYEEPSRHWVLNEAGHPTGDKQSGRRRSFYMIPVPAARRERMRQEGLLELDEGEATPNDNANRIREHVAKWRKLPESQWNVTESTARLLRHWREGETLPKPFFCQIEAAETLIWLAEVAPHTKAGKEILQDLREANEEANAGLLRFATKMATGSGKTTVMAMMIAYHAINKARNPSSPSFCANFLLITPGITIKDRLRVLLPQDPQNYYQTRGIVPPDMLADVQKARVVITNYHTFARRELRDIPAKARQRLQGNNATLPDTKETEGQMLNRACPELLRAGEVIVINDEAHHCYRHKESGEDKKTKAAQQKLTEDEKEEARKHGAAARLWINGILALNERIKIRAIYDLSATPFFLAGAGFPVGQMFPWVVSDFPLMDAIECGIIKVPRVPTDDATGEPVFRTLYHRIKERLPKRGRAKQKSEGGAMNPDDLPSQLQGALQTLYTNYKETDANWRAAKIPVPPVFIVICNNTSTSELVYKHIAGYQKNGACIPGKFPLLSNIRDGKPLSRPQTLLIDSYQLESGEAMDKEFKKAAAEEIAIFKDDIRTRYRGARDADKLTDEDLLREVMNTVGKEGKLGEQIRCVVSVSMLTEGWDTSNVTHILGVRAFGTQLLCEQVVGRALRRVNYDTDKDERLSPEYANIFGVPFNFVCAGSGPVSPPKPQVRVRHLDERNDMAISYPRVCGYKTKPPESHLVAKFDKNSHMKITAQDSPPKVLVEGIVGKPETMTLDALKARRINEVVYSLAAHTAQKYYADAEGNIPPSRFADLAPIVREWLGEYLTCLNDTFAQYLLWAPLADKAAARINRACTINKGAETLLPIIDPFTKTGSTHYVDFLTSKKLLYDTQKSHINIAACDSNWEMDFCRLLESADGVFAYAHSARLGFVVPYEEGKQQRQYHPDFIVLVDDGKKAHDDDHLHLVVEIKGYRGGSAQAKADTMNRLWIPAVNNDGRFGRWAFEEIMDPQEFKATIQKHIGGNAKT